MGEEDICIGDIVSLHSEETRGFVCSYQSSSFHNEIGVGIGQHEKDPVIPIARGVQFKICAQNRYKANKRLPKIKHKSEMEPYNIAARGEFAKAKRAAAAETSDNEVEQKRQEGKPLYYGQIIQLKHAFTEKFIHVNTTQTSWTESSNLMTELLPQNGKRAMFKILPRYKVKSEGDMVQNQDLLILESVKSPGQYLHVSRLKFPDTMAYTDCRELNLAVIPSGFSLIKCSSSSINSVGASIIRGNSVVQLFHKEMEGFITAEGLFGKEVIENVHLRLRQVTTSNHKSLRPPTSSITCWTIEKENSVLDGNDLSWDDNIRLAHLTTRQYLFIDANLCVGVTQDRSDPMTVFRLHPIARRSEWVQHKSYLRIQHVMTSSWLHGNRLKEYQRLRSRGVRNGKPGMENLEWSRSQLVQLEGFKEMMYDDAYTVYLVKPENVKDLNYVAGMVPFLQKLLSEFHHCETFSPRHMSRVISALRELKDFMRVNQQPVKNKQKQLRSFMIVDIIVDLLKCHSQDATSQDFVNAVHEECYNILKVYLEGYSAKNELYLAKHFDFFQTQLEKQGSVGLNAAQMLMELLKDNRSIIDLVAEAQIDMFIGLIVKNKNYRYLELLSVLCIANDITLPDNQTYIACKWLSDCPRSGTNVLNFLGMGQDIGKTKDVAFISTDMKKSWIQLVDFVGKNGKATRDEIQFLEYQLQLFSYLCKGRNSQVIELITEKENMVSWGVAFHCMRNETIPDSIRALCAAIVKDLFIDVGLNFSIMDRVKLVFEYEEVALPGERAKTGRVDSILSGCIPLPFIKELKVWISGLFEQNKSMVASEVSRNELLAEVLRLVYGLVNFGYYGDTEDIFKLLQPMLSLMDGRNDLPFPIKSDAAVLSAQVNEELERYRGMKRFKKGVQNNAVVEAKLQAMKVVELFFNFRFNTRLSNFIVDFKKTVVREGSDELSEFLDEEKDTEKFRDPQHHKVAVKRLTELFKQTDYFDASFVEILKDLLNYQHEEIATASLILLNRFYSAHENLFKLCIATQLLVTESSVDAFRKISSAMSRLKMLKQSKKTDETIDSIIDIFQEFTRLCSLKTDVRENHPLNQEMLHNYGAMADVFDLLGPFSNKKGKVAVREAELDLLRYCFRFLKALARGYKDVQQTLFSYLDFFLCIQGSDAELGEMLSEIFKGNMGNCLKVSPATIKAIVQRYVNSFHPVWISLLSCLVVSEVFPIKRNQNLVVKALMTFQESLSLITETGPAAKYKILKGEEGSAGSYKGGGGNSRNQLCSVIYLFSMCALGENKSIESICQCLLSMDELLNFISLDSLCNGLRLPFVNFITTGYLHSYSVAAQNEMNEYGKDPRLVKFIKSTVNTLVDGIKIVEADKKQALELLRQRPANLHRKKSDINHEKKETLHYIFDGLLPFLYAIFEKHHRSTVKLEPLVVREILNGLVKFAYSAQPAMSRAFHRALLLNTLRLISHTCSLPINLPPQLQIRIDTNSEARNDYNQEYEKELELNMKFDAFARNLQAAYEGQNSVRAQVGHPVETPYVDTSSEEALPLGEEFQLFVSCFLQPKGKKGDKDRKYNIDGLLKHLNWSIKLASSSKSEKERRNLENLDVKCIRILRTMIYNETVRLPKSKASNPSAYMKIMKEMQVVQISLDSQGLIEAVLPHLARTNDEIVRECFNLLNHLYKGNSKTPDTFVRFILAQHEEAFFVAVHARFQTTASLIKEQKFVHTLYQRAMKNSKTLMNTDRNRSRSERGSAHSVMSVFKGGLDTGIGGVNQLKNFFVSKVAGDEGLEMAAVESQEKDKAAEPSGAFGPNKDKIPLIIETTETDSAEKRPPPKPPAEPKFEADALEMEAPDLSVYHDIGDLRVVLRTLQSLSDLEFTSAQDLMREQPENVKSVNLVQENCHLLSLLYTNIDSAYIELVSELLETLVEFVQGNQKNQAVVFDSKVIDYLNHMLRAESYPECSTDDILRLENAIGTVIRFLTEENQGHMHRFTQSKLILAAVNKEGIWNTALECYKRTADETLSKEQKLQSLDIGFMYFGILRRAMDLGLDDAENYESFSAWKFYHERTMALEMVKNDTLQRIYFRVTDQKALRKEVEEQMKWEVDRSSHGNKMRDFMAWIKDIHDDILLQRKIHAHFLGRFFVRRWKFFNYTILLCTMLLNLLMMIMWKEDVHRTSAYEDFWLYHKEGLDIPWRILGAIHNVCALCLVISYFCSNAAGFLSSTRTYIRRIKKLNKLMLIPSHIDPHERPSKLEVNIIGIQTIYYVLFFTFSIVGTVVSPAFFAFHLLQVVENNQLLTRVIRAVTLNGRSLLWVALMGVIIMYIYGLIAFLTLRNVMHGNLHFCESLWQCFLSTMREGLIYKLTRIDYPIKRQWGLNAAGDPFAVNDNENFSLYTFKLFWDLSFFIIILTIGLNVIFGIIVDTFRQLRDAKWRIEQDMETRCFICGRNSYEFEQRGISFKYHQTTEHGMLAYVFFFVRLQDMPTEELSHLEMYIKKAVKHENFNFFPLNRAVSLLENEIVDASAERDHTMMSQLNEIMRKLNEEENYRQRQALRQQQREWDALHRQKGSKTSPSPFTPALPALPKPDSSKSGDYEKPGSHSTSRTIDTRLSSERASPSSELDSGATTPTSPRKKQSHFKPSKKYYK